MQIKAILFDMDGVIIEAKKIHYDALNDALPDEYKISWEEHLSKYDGLKTNQKLDLLKFEKNLPDNLRTEIWNLKQQNTMNAMKSIQPNLEIIEVFKTLKDLGYKIGICSNSIKSTVHVVISKLQLLEYVDVILSNEDVKNSKPHPEIYWKSISILNIDPFETLIIEDSPMGLQAASKTSAHIMRVKNINDVNLKNIIKKINDLNMSKNHKSPKWKDEKLNILIPMAGAGSRFEKAGYVFPKPLIEVNGKPMIQLVIENLNIDANYIYVVQKQHRLKYNLDSLLNLITPNCKIVEVDGLTEGAACTALLAKQYIDNDNPLFFANSDQFVEWDSNTFMYKMNENDADCGVVTFKAIHPKWSFVKINNLGLITEVSEKNPISDNATVGFYYWKHGKEFVKYAEQMINNNIRVNNEFYVCPVFNEALKDNFKIIPFNIEKMWGLGTPEDLENYLKNYKIK